eukprot:TRINITY_DN4594_c0_g1_i1.p1 TRINITY_DN4594_c0_g1~~TRINITY_DN4594_c0_g1_i1.p1  ORF type:complete len:336 (+),score=51.91 TRINITY_DN4594_c0_g1_i1:185-1192(+)
MVSFSLSESLSVAPNALQNTSGVTRIISPLKLRKFNSCSFSAPTSPILRSLSDTSFPPAHSVSSAGVHTSGSSPKGRPSPTSTSAPESKELHLAIKEKNQLSVSSILCTNRTVINVPDERGYTPLHVSAEVGDTEIVKLLLSYKPNVEARDKLGLTPLHVAVMNGRREVIDILSRNQKERESIFPKNTPSGGNQTVDVKKDVFDDNIYLLQRNHWKEDFLERVEFLFESKFGHNVRVGMKFPDLGDNVCFYRNNEELKMKRNKNYSWTIQPFETLIVMSAERKFPQSGKAKSMGFPYSIGYKWKHKWFWLFNRKKETSNRLDVAATSETAKAHRG